MALGMDGLIRARTARENDFQPGYHYSFNVQIVHYFVQSVYDGRSVI